MVNVYSWGRLAQSEHKVIGLAHRDQAKKAVGNNTPGIAYGMGRSYGDVCLNPGGNLWLTRGLDRFISFDPETGILQAEAGVLLKDIQHLAIERGWMLPVTPGTQFVTLGGAIANDVHGKNHHRRGSFGDHLLQIELTRTDGQTLVCSPQQNPDWFAATVGGLGLTGVILSASIQLKKTSGSWVEQETIPYHGLADFFHLADESEAEWEYTVSWIDCLARNPRGIFIRGNPATTDEHPVPRGKRIAVPFAPPISMINKASLLAFNSAYFHSNSWQAGRSLSHYQPFFYPLDNLLNWNLLYGRRGFYQYQVQVPHNERHDAIASLLRLIRESGEGSFLAVLKTFGERRSLGMLGFPRPGVTLALDFPNRGEKTLQLFSRLDQVVREAGGCIYPAKDARMPADLFHIGFPQAESFSKFRDPGISSAMSRRLFGS